MKILRLVILFAWLTITFFALSGCAPLEAITTSIQATQESVIEKLTPASTAPALMTVEPVQHNSSIGGQTPMATENDILEFTEADSGKHISITAGATILIHLKSQTSTGYNWTVSEIDGGVLAQDGEPSFSTSDKLIGAGETTVWKFNAVGVGNTLLKLIYSRAFEKGKPPLKTFELTIQVEG